jgi:hypothetical protein
MAGVIKDQAIPAVTKIVNNDDVKRIPSMSFSPTLFEFDFNVKSF